MRNDILNNKIEKYSELNHDMLVKYYHFVICILTLKQLMTNIKQNI